MNGGLCIDFYYPVLKIQGDTVSDKENRVLAAGPSYKPIGTHDEREAYLKM